MKRNKLVSIIESSVKSKVLVGVLAASLIGASGMMLASGGNLSNNNFSVNKTMLAGTLNNKGNKACVINGDDNLVLYATANHSNIQSYVSVGEMLTINSYDNGYYNVTVQETGATGYISSSDMQKIVSGVGNSLTSLSGTAYTTNVSTMVNLREEATMNSISLAMLKNNTSVSLLAKQGNWYKVDVNGTIGYIYGEYIALSNTGSTNTTNSISSSSNTTSSNTSKTIGTTKSDNSTSSIKTASSKNPSSTGSTIKQSRTTAYINQPEYDKTAGIYEGPSGESTLETTLQSGTKITVLGSESYGWYKIEFDNNQIGYIPAKYVSFNKPSTGSSSNQENKIGYVAQGGAVGIYEGPSGLTTVVSSLQSGTKITVLGSESYGWYKIEFDNNQIGYIPAKYVSFNKPSTGSSSNQENKIGYVAQGGAVGIYEGPSGLTTVVSSLQSGTKITVLGSESYGWYKIEYNNNQIGYIPAKYVSFNN